MILIIISKKKPKCGDHQQYKTKHTSVFSLSSHKPYAAQKSRNGTTNKNNQQDTTISLWNSTINANTNKPVCIGKITGQSDHLLAIKIPIEKSMEHNRPLELVFIDSYNTFEAVKLRTIIASREECRMNYRYTRLIYGIQ